MKSFRLPFSSGHNALAEVRYRHFGVQRTCTDRDYRELTLAKNGACQCLVKFLSLHTWAHRALCRMELRFYITLTTGKQSHAAGLVFFILQFSLERFCFSWSRVRIVWQLLEQPGDNERPEKVIA